VSIVLLSEFSIYLYIDILVMNTQTKKLTSVRIDEELFTEFKFQCVKDRFSFQKLASRAIYLYLTDKEFKNTIQNQVINFKKVNGK